MSLPSIRAIISGGQSGVDRAAHEVADSMGFPVDGWCPADHSAEDGTVHHNLRPTPTAAPSQRTSWNVYDSDATLILARTPLSGGTLYTRQVAQRCGRPCLVLDPGASEARSEVLAWLSELPDPLLLNIAGPRESKEPGIRGVVREFLTSTLSELTLGSAGLRRALITGALGLVGMHLRELAPPGWEPIGVVRSQADAKANDLIVAELSDRAAVARMIDEVQPDLIIHTAYSTRDMERDILRASENVAASGVPLIHLSSDMVLDGESAPFADDAPVKPVNEYGKWKGRAEQRVQALAPEAAILRLSLVMDFDPPDPRTEIILDQIGRRQETRLYVDEMRTPILVDDLARQIWEIARLPSSGRAGVWNLASPEAFSRFGLGALIATAAGADTSYIRGAYNREAPEPRPRDLRLSTDRADRYLLTRSRSVSEAAADFKQANRKERSQ